MAVLEKLQQRTLTSLSLFLNCINCLISLVFQGLDNDTDKIQWTTNKWLWDFKPKPRGGQEGLPLTKAKLNGWFSVRPFMLSLSSVFQWFRPFHANSYRFDFAKISLIVLSSNLLSSMKLHCSHFTVM